MIAKKGAGVWEKIWAPFAGARGLDDKDIVAANARDEPHVAPWLRTKKKPLPIFFEDFWPMFRQDNFGSRDAEKSQIVCPVFY